MTREITSRMISSLRLLPLPRSLRPALGVLLGVLLLLSNTGPGAVAAAGRTTPTAFVATRHSSHPKLHPTTIRGRSQATTVTTTTTATVPFQFCRRMVPDDDDKAEPTPPAAATSTTTTLDPATRRPDAAAVAPPPVESSPDMEVSTYPIDLPSPVLLASSMVLAIASVGTSHD